MQANVKYSILHFQHKLKKSLYCQKGGGLCRCFALLTPEGRYPEGNEQH